MTAGTITSRTWRFASCDRIDLLSVAAELEVAVQGSMAPASLVLWLRGDAR